MKWPIIWLGKLIKKIFDVKRGKSEPIFDILIFYQYIDLIKHVIYKIKIQDSKSTERS